MESGADSARPGDEQGGEVAVIDGGKRAAASPEALPAAPEPGPDRTGAPPGGVAAQLAALRGMLRPDRLGMVALITVAYLVTLMGVLLVITLAREHSLLFRAVVYSTECVGYFVFLYGIGRLLDENSALWRYLLLAVLFFALRLAIIDAGGRIPDWPRILDAVNILMFAVLIGVVLRPGWLRMLAMWAAFGVALSLTNKLVSAVMEGVLGGI